MAAWEPIVTSICTTMMVTGALFWWAVKLAIKAALADFMKQLNGTYRRTAECDLIRDEVERRLIVLEQGKD